MEVTYNALTIIGATNMGPSYKEVRKRSPTHRSMGEKKDGGKQEARSQKKFGLSFLVI